MKRRPDGEIDLAALPLDGILRQALKGGEEARAAIRVLSFLHQQGREEAGVFLLGLLAAAGEDWRRREELVRALKWFETPGCVYFLCAELRRVKGSNSTRRYLNAILEVLAQMPADLVENELKELARDPALSRRMRQKVERILWDMMLRGLSKPD